MHFLPRKIRKVWTTKGLGDDNPTYWNRVGIIVPTQYVKYFNTVKHILERRKSRK